MSKYNYYLHHQKPFQEFLIEHSPGTNVLLLDSIELTVYKEVGMHVSFFPKNVGTASHSEFNKYKQWVLINNFIGCSSGIQL